MEDKLIKSTDKEILIPTAILFLIAGSLFLFIGAFIIWKYITLSFIEHKNVFDLAIIFLVIFLPSIGVLLILTSWKFLKGNTDNQNVSAPVFLFLTLFFFGLSIFLLLLVFVFSAITIDRGTVRGIGFALGFGSLCFFMWYKRKKSNNDSK